MNDIAKITVPPSSIAVLRTRFNEWLASIRRIWTAPAPAPLAEEAWDRLEETAAASAAILAQQRREAPPLLAELLGQTAGDRMATVARDRRFLSVPLAQLLLDQELRDPADDSLARCVLVIAGSIAPTVIGSGPLENLKTAAWIQIGQCHRAAGQLAEADHAFLRAAFHLSAAPEPLEEANLHRARALLFRDRGNVALAARLQRRAVDLLASFALAPTTCVALAELAALSLEAGHSRDAELALQRAAFLMHDNPKAVALAADSLEELAWRLAAANRQKQARALIDAALLILQPLLSPSESARLTWTKRSTARFR
jgi:tetratricopeptide (TPR) repeat protein